MRLNVVSHTLKLALTSTRKGSKSMKRKALIAFVAATFGLLCLQVAFADSPTPLSALKHTPQGKYIIAKELYQRWFADPKSITIVDVRIPEEYVYIGHPAMAINIPFSVWTGKYDPDKRTVALAENPEFVAEIQKIVKPSDTLYLICRSGDRAAAAAVVLNKHGYKNVYNVVDGFEGDFVTDPESYFEGKRMRNGWKNSGAPWTYGLDPKLMPTMPLK
jgi:rhodanese-related sulfurtransferase